MTSEKMNQTLGVSGKPDDEQETEISKKMEPVVHTEMIPVRKILLVDRDVTETSNVMTGIPPDKVIEGSAETETSAGMVGVVEGMIEDHLWRGQAGEMNLDKMAAGHGKGDIEMVLVVLLEMPGGLIEAEETTVDHVDTTEMIVDLEGMIGMTVDLEGMIEMIVGHAGMIEMTAGLGDGAMEVEENHLAKMTVDGKNGNHQRKKFRGEGIQRMMAPRLFERVNLKKQMMMAGQL